MAIKFTDTSLFEAVRRSAKSYDKAESKALRTGANVVKKHIRDALRATKLDVTSTGQYKDRLIDAVRSSKPIDGEIKVHILGTMSKGSGTFRLRFFEYATKRYQRKGLTKPRYIGHLGKYNGFFQQGWSKARGEAMSKLSDALEKYIEDAWNNR